MVKKKHFSLKKILFFFVALGVLWVSPDQLYSVARSTTSMHSATTEIAQASRTTDEDKKFEKEKSTQEQILERFDPLKKPSLITQAAVLTLLSLLPFIIMILTSFMKIVIVLSLLRNASGQGMRATAQQHDRRNNPV